MTVGSLSIGALQVRSASSFALRKTLTRSFQGMKTGNPSWDCPPSGCMAHPESAGYEVCHCTPNLYLGPASGEGQKSCQGFPQEMNRAQQSIFPNKPPPLKCQLEHPWTPTCTIAQNSKNWHSWHSYWTKSRAFLKGALDASIILRNWDNWKYTFHSSKHSELKTTEPIPVN